MIDPLAIATNGYISKYKRSLSIATDGYLSVFAIIIIEFEERKGRKGGKIKGIRKDQLYRNREELMKNLKREENEVVTIINIFMIIWGYENVLKQ